METVEDLQELEAKDIELVMSQVGCSRGKAVAALKANNGAQSPLANRRITKLLDVRVL